MTLAGTVDREPLYQQQEESLQKILPQRAEPVLEAIDVMDEAGSKARGPLPQLQHAAAYSAHHLLHHYDDAAVATAGDCSRHVLHCLPGSPAAFSGSGGRARERGLGCSCLSK